MLDMPGEAVRRPVSLMPRLGLLALKENNIFFLESSDWETIEITGLAFSSNA